MTELPRPAALAGASRVRIDLIDDSDRLRAVDPSWVEVIQASMAERGLDEPITLRPIAGGERLKLVAGGHRLQAARNLGWSEIDAKVRQLNDLEARLVEIEENLVRHELTALDRAIFLAEHKAAYEALHPEVAHGGDRKSRKKQGENQVASFATRYSKQAANRTGLSERTIQSAVSLVRALGPEAIAKLRGTPIAQIEAQLWALARHEPDDRAKLVDIIAHHRFQNVSSALVHMGKGAPSVPESEAAFRALVTAWERAGKGARDRFLKRIGARA